MPGLLNTRVRPLLKWSNDDREFQYIVTDQDRAWFARAIWREGTPRVAVGYTLLQRFASLYPKYQTFAKFLRAYCQPINPAWYTTGFRHKRLLKSLRKKRDAQGIAAEIERARRRERYSTTPVAQIPENYRILADRILTGAPHNPVPTAEHFCISLAPSGASHAVAVDAARRYAERKRLPEPLAVAGGFGRGNNWFFQPRSGPPPRLAFDRHTETVSGALAQGGSSGAGAATAVALGLFALGRKKR